MVLFKLIDEDASGTIEVEEALKYWKNQFAQLSAEELFAAVDDNNDESITVSEWLDFWRTVLKSGHTEAEVLEEVEG